ncbi:MAG: mitochondrial fission ELM1 family protein [Candidatus Omnitrophica bacterium]|nr:mitochondrial fission ELM1 family protein [Candidatus Omnitrophota bacterium]
MKILVLSDGIRGNLNQSLGIAERIEGSERIKTIEPEYRGPIYRLTGGRKGRYKFLAKICALLYPLLIPKLTNFYLKMILTSSSYRKLFDHSADFVISAGSTMAPLNLLLGRIYKAKKIVCMNPPILGTRYFDLAIIPEHDYKRIRFLKKPKNLFITIGAPNRINLKALKEEAERLNKRIQCQSKVKIGILLGGDDQNYHISKEWIKVFLEEMKKFTEKVNGDILLTTSRRTLPEVEKACKEMLSSWMRCKLSVIANETGENPVRGMLGLCSIIFTTEDSIAMSSETASSPATTIVIKVERKNKRHLVFDETFKNLSQDGYLHLISLRELPNLSKIALQLLSQPTKILNETEKAAEAVRKLMR